MRSLMANRTRQRRSGRLGSETMPDADQAESPSHSAASSADGDYDPTGDIADEKGEADDVPQVQHNDEGARPPAKRGRPRGSGKGSNPKRTRVDIPWQAPFNAEGPTWGLAREALVLYRDKAAPYRE